MYALVIVPSLLCIGLGVTIYFSQAFTFGGAGGCDSVVDPRLSFKDIGSAKTSCAFFACFEDGCLSAVCVGRNEESDREIATITDGGNAFKHINVNDSRCIRSDDSAWLGSANLCITLGDADAGWTAAATCEYECKADADAKRSDSSRAHDFRRDFVVS